MRWTLPAIILVVTLSSCTSTYPYLITTNECRCEHFVYRGESGQFELEVSASYVVTDRISSEVELVFHNFSRDSLSLRQAYIKGTSTNVRYQNNDRFQAMPYEIIPPGGRYAMTLRGTDSEVTENPWLKIAGEKVVIQIQGLLIGRKPVAPVVVTLVPLNPKLS